MLTTVCTIQTVGRILRTEHQTISRSLRTQDNTDTDISEMQTCRQVQLESVTPVFLLSRGQ
jgi:hypothetical protein